jgi:hypothetical protein
LKALCTSRSAAGSSVRTIRTISLSTWQ